MANSPNYNLTSEPTQPEERVLGPLQPPTPPMPMQPPQPMPYQMQGPPPDMANFQPWQQQIFAQPPPLGAPPSTALPLWNTNLLPPNAGMAPPPQMLMGMPPPQPQPMTPTLGAGTKARQPSVGQRIMDFFARQDPMNLQAAGAVFQESLTKGGAAGAQLGLNYQLKRKEMEQQRELKELQVEQQRMEREDRARLKQETEHARIARRLSDLGIAEDFYLEYGDLTPDTLQDAYNAISREQSRRQGEKEKDKLRLSTFRTGIIPKGHEGDEELNRLVRERQRENERKDARHDAVMSLINARTDEVKRRINKIYGAGKVPEEIKSQMRLLEFEIRSLKAAKIDLDQAYDKMRPDLDWSGYRQDLLDRDKDYSRQIETLQARLDALLQYGELPEDAIARTSAQAGSPISPEQAAAVAALVRQGFNVSPPPAGGAKAGNESAKISDEEMNKFSSTLDRLTQILGGTPQPVSPRQQP